MTLKSGLKVYYNMDGNADDALGVNNAVASGVSWVSGKIGQAAKYTGTGTIISNNNTGFSGDVSFSISAWFYVNDITGQHQIVTFGVKSTDQMVQFGILNWLGVDSLGFWGWGGASLISTPVLKNVWYHAVATYDSGTGARSLYLNGVLKATTNRAFSIGVSKFNVGFLPSDISFNGLLDEIGVWDRVLTLDEIEDLYNAGSGNTYPFDFYFISGIVKKGDELIENAIVRAIDQETNNALDYQVTDENGFFKFENLLFSKKYHLMVEYENGDGELFNAESFWDVEPVIET